MARSGDERKGRGVAERLTAAREWSGSPQRVVTRHADAPGRVVLERQRIHLARMLERR